MNLKEQLYVCTIARCGTISQAARELYISAPALSVYLRNLENSIGVRLFDRTGRTLVPTCAGEEYLKYAVKMLQMKDEFDSFIEEIRKKKNVSIKIGIQMRRAITLVPYITSCFMKEYPDINLVFMEGVYDELMKMYNENVLDFLICIQIEELDNAEYVELGEEPVLIVLPDTHAANKYAEFKEGDSFGHLDFKYLEHETFILPLKNQSMRTTAENILRKYNVIPERIIEMSNFETIVSMVEHGIGIGFNRAGYISTLSRFDKVRYYMIGEEPYCSRLVFVHRKGAAVPPYMRRFIELLKECINIS